MLEVYLPEGRLLHTAENQTACATPAGLVGAMEEGKILEGEVLLCDAQHRLLVQVGPYTALMPRQEVALGVAEGQVKEIAILSRVGKPICFLVESVSWVSGQLNLQISRRAAQAKAEAALLQLQPGQICPATVTHLESFGAFVDVGCGLISMVGIERISLSRIPHPRCRFGVGQEIFVLVQEVLQEERRLKLSHRELLGTWAENIAKVTAGMTLTGHVRGIQSYGAFIELFPNLSGLAEPRADLEEGDRVSVYIKSILPQRMKLKLMVLELLSPIPEPLPFQYAVTEGSIRHWRYAPADATKPGMEVLFA